ncbi:MAG: hypothetical protein AAAB35_00755 [Phyllobacterium sp.]|uniref:hypothetical protein n=1 Tax=Phyllobacterium sp. TaxID=1871046 RepID=UPI0030F02817
MNVAVRGGKLSSRDGEPGIHLGDAALRRLHAPFVEKILLYGIEGTANVFLRIQIGDHIWKSQICIWVVNKILKKGAIFIRVGHTQRDCFNESNAIAVAHQIFGILAHGLQFSESWLFGDCEAAGAQNQDRDEYSG